MKKNKSFLLIAAVLTFLFTLQPTHLLAQENIVDRLNKALNLKLPDKYDAEARKFIEKFEIIKDKDVIAFTEKFLVEQMKEDLGVNKQDQYLFLLTTCFEEITRDNLYYGDDENEKRFEDFANVWDKLEQIKKKYGEGLDAYLKQLSAEAKQRSAEVQQRIAEADRQIAEADRKIAEAQQQAAEYKAKTIKSLNELLNLFKKFYLSYKQSPNEEQLRKFKENAQELVPLCKKYEVDYKKTLTAEMLKFYGIE